LEAGGKTDERSETTADKTGDGNGSCVSGAKVAGLDNGKDNKIQVEAQWRKTEYGKPFPSGKDRCNQSHEEPGKTPRTREGKKKKKERVEEDSETPGRLKTCGVRTWPNENPREQA